MFEAGGIAGSGPKRGVLGVAINRRTIQVVLGCIWILDAALQYQPSMFTHQFVDQVILPNAQNQPSWLAATVTHMGNFISRDVGLWNFLFATIQLGIGVGLLFRRSVKPALVVSFAWALGVWVIGEGMGSIFTGSASPLMGAPGAVLLYAAIGVLVWPDPERDPEERRTGIASSAAGEGPFGAKGALIVWSVLWAGFAMLFLFPDNRKANALHDMVAGMASGQPGWYAHLLNSLAHAFVGAGTATSVILAIACLVIAIAPLVSRNPTPFLAGGAVLAVIFWVTGEALGGILTGIGTDPNSGPLLVLLAVSLLPMVPAPAAQPAPAMRVFARHPAWATSGLAGLVIVPLLVATIPVASAEAVHTPAAKATPTQLASGSSAVQGTSGSSGSTGTSAMSGMSMSGTSGSKGASGSTSSKSTDMSGMAGLGATDPTWHYNGPPLPASEVSLLTASSNMQDEGHAMQTPNCNTKPTANQVLGATEYVQAVSSAVAKYKELSVAVAAGYKPITSPGYPVVHYLNYSYMKPQYVMDPNHVDSLVYAFTPNGPVLVAAMFLMPGINMKGPMPYGCLVQWHAHTNLCFSQKTHVIVGFTPCPAGEYNVRTPVMTHVWQVPVPGGPLAIDPSDLVTVEAAIQAQQEGLAPVTSPSGAVSYETASASVGGF